MQNIYFLAFYQVLTWDPGKTCKVISLNIMPKLKSYTRNKEKKKPYPYKQNLKYEHIF